MADGQSVLDQYEGLYEYVPYLSHQELKDVYRDSDLFVIPSYLDSWAMVVPECMACGTPVIVSENTGSKDVVKNGGGSIVSIDDAKAIATEIQKYLDDRSLVERNGRKAVEVVKEYSWENYYKKIETTITEILPRS
jgi:glycosyltransferase involved in cell wall biosynthesis